MKPAVFRLARLFATLLLCTLGGCSWLAGVPGMNRIAGEEGVFRDRQGEYLEATTIPRTRIPEGMDGFIIDDLLVVPEPRGEQSEAFLDAPRPRPLEGRSDREVVIQRMLNRSWIVVDASPGEVWPRIRDYFRSAGIAIAAENPTAGVMDTAWFIPRTDTLNRHKLRVTVETGFQNNSSEIRLLHITAPQATPVFEQVNWPVASRDPETAYEMLSDLSTYLADVADLYQASSVSFQASNIPSEGKATIVEATDGSEILRLQADYDRSWAAVGRALVRSNVEIITQDAGQGVYEVQFIPGSEEQLEDEPGFFKKVFTLGGIFSREEDLPAYRLRVQVLDWETAAEVQVSPIEPSGGDGREAAGALLRLIRNTIA
jgi:outer membrane protein assembly factor BamC